MLYISAEQYLGEGNQKLVFRHPYNHGQCIKFPKKDKKRRARGLKREIFYTKKHQSRLPFLAKYLESVDTNLGCGYVFELIRDEDGAISPTLNSVIHGLEKDWVVEKVEAMYQQLLSSKAAVSDLHPGNFLVQKGADDSCQLVLIDGFGNSDAIKVCDYFSYFLKKKLDRQFSRLWRQLKMA